MAEMQFDLSGRKGLAALTAVVILVALRAAALGATDDPALHAAIRAHLLNDVGANVAATLENLDPADPAGVAQVLEAADAGAIALHEVRVSKPLLAVGSGTEAIVHCDYSLPGAPRQSAWWRFRDQAIGGWRYLGRSSAFSYYLNFL